MDENIAIVVPCYNEYTRLPKEDFIKFIKKSELCKIVFSDDGSTDKTIEVLEEIKSVAPDRVFINAIINNGGKAAAVRSGVLFCYNNDLEFDKIAFLDSDLATSLNECIRISKRIKRNIVFSFASRIQKIDNIIDRKLYRHIIGRVIATVISIILGMNVYDTQCGCKVFTRDLAVVIFKEKFISKWLFDVELFFRIKYLYKGKKMKKIAREIPLKSWIDKDESKVKFSYSLKLWLDLYRINKKYNKNKLSNDQQ